MYSQAVTHPSTNIAQCCLTSVIGRELVCSTWYGRRRDVRGNFGKTTNRLKVESKKCDVGSREHFLPTWDPKLKKHGHTCKNDLWSARSGFRKWQTASNIVILNFSSLLCATASPLAPNKGERSERLPLCKTHFLTKRQSRLEDDVELRQDINFESICWLVGKWADHGGTAMPSQPVKKPEQAPELSPLTKISLISKEAHGHRIRY